MKTIEVKPCPFCGEPPKVRPWHGGGPRKTLVHCGDDYCRVAPMVAGSTKARAIRFWNQREAE